MMQRRDSRQAGAVMIEAVLTLPLILFVLSLLLFFGWGMLRFHQAGIVDRYEARRQATLAPGPGARRDATGVRRTGQLNEAFFRGEAAGIAWLQPDDYWAEAPAAAFNADQQLAIAAGQNVAEAGQLAQRINERSPRLSVAAFRTSHTSDVPLWREIDGPISHGHVRLGHDWRFVNHVLNRADDVWYASENDRWHELRTQRDNAGRRVPTFSHTEALRDTFFRELDNRLAPLASGGNASARNWRQLYLARPRYRGPELPENWVFNRRF